LGTIKANFKDFEITCSKC